MNRPLESPVTIASTSRLCGPTLAMRTKGGRKRRRGILIAVVNPTDLRGILQYVPQVREKTFVLAKDGAIVAGEHFASLLLDVAVFWSLNIRVVLVHGASAHVTVSDIDATASRTPYA